jgi:protein phosphatase 1 regulatory subunit 7
MEVEPVATDGSANPAKASPEAVPAVPPAEESGPPDEDAADDVPPPPPPHPVAPSERRARVELPPAEPDEGPTYFRIGIDHPYSPEDEEISLQCTRIKKLENLEAAGPRLKKLCLIANCVEKIENLDTNVNLEHLELYQNLVKKIENISHLTSLTNLDLSFNKIRSTAALSSCPFDQLERLYLSSNKIQEAEGIFHLHSLKMLELGSNRIRGMPPQLEQLSNLQELWLGRNKIVSMGLPPLPALQHLSMQSNRLEVWDPSLFHNCPALSHLYLGHNNLPDLPEEIGLLTELEEFDLAGNAITTIRPVSQLTKLEDLWMNDNKVAELEEVRNLASFPGLKTVYLERNPMQGLGDTASEARYKDAILQAVPDLEQLDAVRLNHKVQVITNGSERQVVGIRKR